ncbi:hypothetical protein GPX89_29335 [Nocardia sp. ET3-3]|uniref:OmpR/PhoB-type domain-containing protein n=1 Tax=Nocardia terrae TaxID=2675851 RepID=A0A7K1V3X2_9NOCA|nr:AfsR/SARP family transcriptional regulator [Nocardia terrae]MVU81333.1 hypothetical protein [Nocardia terrae]
MQSIVTNVGIEARMLGPLHISVNDNRATLSAAKPRTLLALLAINAGRQLSTERLINEIWEEDPPRSAASTLQTYILRIRRLLGDAIGEGPTAVAATLLRTVSGGYALTPDRSWVDVHEFRGLAEQAEMADRRGQTAEAADLYRSAEMLWSGSALIDIEQGPMLRAEVAGLEQTLLCVTERRIAAEMRLGRHRAVLGELASLVARHQFHEDLHAQYMIALHRSGNRSGALEVFHRIRRSMNAELGLEPSRHLRVLQQAIINADSVLELPDQAARTPLSEFPFAS